MNLTAASISPPSTLVVFAHGKESGPWGSKIKHLAALAGQRGAQVLSPDYAQLARWVSRWVFDQYDHAVCKHTC